MNPTLRWIFTFLVLAAAGAALAAQLQGLLADRGLLPPDDFVEYWAAGRLNARGENPYDPRLLLPLERDAGRDTDEAIMMWNPPWTLAVAMPFGLIDSRAAQLLWLMLGLAFVGLSADWLWRLHGGPPHLCWIAWLLAFTFLPTVFVLGAGQIGTWVLLGGTLFLGCLRIGARCETDRGRSLGDALAGASCVLLAIKPHLVYLFWAAILVWAVRNRRWWVLIGGSAAGLLCTGLAAACNPHVIHQYWEAITQRPPAEWKSPTLGALLRMVEGESRFGLQFVPALLGLGWLAWYGWRWRNTTWRWHEQLPLLFLVSFTTASYGAWPFDLVILLPAVMHVAATITRRLHRREIFAALGFWIALNGGALTLNLLKVESFWFIWIAPLMLIAYLFLMRTTENA